MLRNRERRWEAELLLPVPPVFLKQVLWAVVAVIGKLQFDATGVSKKYWYSTHKLGYVSTRLCT